MTPPNELDYFLSSYSYNYPPAQVAQQALPRGDSKVFIARRNQAIEVVSAKELPQVLGSEFHLAANNTKVLPVRMLWHDPQTGGKRELFFVRCLDPVANSWECMVRPSKWFTPGKTFPLGDLVAKVVGNTEMGTKLIQMSASAEDVFALMQSHGAIPLPPYIRRQAQEEDKTRYQSVFASNAGSVAAPTASLHFTDSMVQNWRSNQCWSEVTLHVGLGTFKSVETNDIRMHTMHQEHYVCSKSAADELNLAKSKGKKILAVGTTVCRVLECCAKVPQKLEPGEGWTDIFIYPGYEWKFVDALFTNFHQPQTTLIMLVASLWGREATLKMYNEAIDLKARLFSYGDAMLILP